ncbi:MAG: S1 RNA-binding domain-containing protein, partial [Allomuricauda sp.]
AIAEVVDKGATINFNEDIVGFVPSRHMEKEDGKKLGKGEEVDFKIIEFNKDFKRVVASHTAIFREQEERNVRTAKKRATSSDEAAPTLGDANAQLQALKDKMEADAKK